MERLSSEGFRKPVQPTGIGKTRILCEILLLLFLVDLFLLAGEAIGASTLAGALLTWFGVMQGVGIVWIFFRASNTHWNTIGFRRPESWTRTVILSIFAAIGLIVCGQLILNHIILPLIDAPLPDQHRFDVIRGNFPILLLSLAGMWSSAAFGEEIVFRGYLMLRIAQLFNGGKIAWLLSLIASSTIFGLLHFYQGISGMIITGVLGFLIGTIYLLVQRNIWVVILAHGLIDTLSFLSIYLSGTN